MADERCATTAEEKILLSRRQFNKWIIGAVGAFITTATGVPVLGSVISPAFSKSQEVVVKLHKLEDYAIAEPTLAQFTITRTDGWQRTLESRSVWVIRTSQDEVTVFNGRCTHLGCAYNWKKSGDEADHFVCPCHNGIFTKTGEVAAGPPPRPLDTLPVQIKDGTVVITYKDFRSGVPEKTEV
ncbi:MAG: ubiquinol-cytochrome c reductase iron-sulfur subunit [Chloroflexi bacterium]|nr:ubiquinol-cytochrome c reductase iron-sulfur subunit [Chloroflexota bacterium]